MGLASLVLPYTRRELPGWGRVMSLVGGTTDRLWSGTPLARVRYKWTQSSVWVDLADEHERVVYFCGRYYELGLQLTLRSVLQPGATFVDVGANIGLMTVLAAGVVGSTGVIYAIEPNPACCERLNLHVEQNGLSQVQVHPVGLSDEDGTLWLTRETGSTVHGSFAPPVHESCVTARYMLPVRRGDDLLTEAPTDRAMVIKIDVEGFECRTLRGLARTIARHRPKVLTEVIPEHLLRSGSSVAELFDLMHDFGYSGCAITTVRRWTRHQLRLVPVRTAESMPTKQRMFCGRLLIRQRATRDLGSRRTPSRLSDDKVEMTKGRCRQTVTKAAIVNSERGRRRCQNRAVRWQLASCLKVSTVRQCGYRRYRARRAPSQRTSPKEMPPRICGYRKTDRRGGPKFTAP